MEKQVIIKNMKDNKLVVAVIGLGRFGSFWASLLSTQFEVIAWSRSKNRETPKGVKRVSFEELFEADTLFLCNAISSMEIVATQIAPMLKPSTVVIDTCSVKVSPLTTLREKLPKQIEILGTHPMFGPDSAKSGVVGLPIVVSSFSQTNKTLKFWIESFKAMKLKVIEMSPDEHDREAAYTQGITHFVGRVLNEMHLEESQMATKGYCSLQNIMKQTCNDPWQLFEDLQKYNSYTSMMRDDLHKALALMLVKFDSMNSISTSNEEKNE